MSPSPPESPRLYADLGHPVEERKVDVDEWRKGFGALRWPGGEAVAGSGEPGPVTMKIRQALLDVQYGRVEDTHGWVRKVEQRSI